MNLRKKHKEKRDREPRKDSDREKEITTVTIFRKKTELYIFLIKINCCLYCFSF